jgi:hypothetical protein
MQPNHLPERAADIEASLAKQDPCLRSMDELPGEAMTPPSDVIEIITPGAYASIGAICDESEEKEPEFLPVTVTQDLDCALEAVLAFYGWQHVEVERVTAGVYSVAGSEFQIRCESEVTAEQAASGSPFHLSASSDGGQTWESVASLVRSRRLHKVVRTYPIASPLDSRQDESSENFASRVPISLADLARMPSRSDSYEGDVQFSSSPIQRFGASQQHSGRAGTPPGGRDSPGGSGYNAYSGPSYATGSPTNMPSMSGRSPHTGMARLPLGPDGLPTHLHDGLPTFNNAFPSYFNALSGPKNYYNQFRIPDRQS